MKKITLFLMLITAFVSAQNTKVARSITGSSSIESTSKSFQIKGTLGQLAVGVSAGSEATIASGYWGWISKRTNLNTEKDEIIPSVFKVQPAYPNPFNPTTRVNLQIPSTGEVEINIYDVLGRKVMFHTQNYASAGTYTFHWNPRNASGDALSTGTYIMMVAFNNKIQTQKITFLK
mgnify:FL=1|tara:strand:+ start:483 stop:1010 length:528 start_codon:yes stop_codon:yes gene_type:complete